MQQSTDITITSPQIVTMNVPLLLDSANHIIRCTNNSGICLTLDGGPGGTAKSEGHTRTFIWRDFIVDGSGSSGSGVLIRNVTAGPIIQGRIQNFDSIVATAEALTLNNVEDAQITITLFHNYNGVQLQNGTNNNEILLWADNGGDPSKRNPDGIAISVEGSSVGMPGNEGNTFRGLVQSNFGTRTVILGWDSARNTFQNMWFENNGDGTPRTRLVTFNSKPGHFILNTRFESCDISAGSLGRLGSIFTASSADTLAMVTMANNYAISYSSFADNTLANLGKFLGINENDTVAGAQSFYGATLRPGGISSAGIILTGKAPDSGPGQIGVGGTIVPPSFCGSLKGSTGCMVVNISGKSHYLPIW
jgi:hypothetical protein